MKKIVEVKKKVVEEVENNNNIEDVEDVREDLDDSGAHEGMSKGDKRKKSGKSGKKVSIYISISATALVVIIGVVFLILALTGAFTDKDRLATLDSYEQNLQEVSDLRGEVEEFLKADLTDLKDLDDDKLGSFSETIEHTEELIEKVNSGLREKDNAGVMIGTLGENGSVVDLLDEVMSKYANLNTCKQSAVAIYNFAAEAKKGEGISASITNELSALKSERLQELGKDLNDYRKMLLEFQKNYGGEKLDAENSDGSNDADAEKSDAEEKEEKTEEDYDADLEALQKKISDIQSKYEKVTFEDICGGSIEEILSFYDKVDELKNTRENWK